MRTKYKSKRGRKTNKRGRKTKYNTKGSSTKKILLFFIVVGIALYYLYTIAPDVITISVSLKDEQKEEIKNIVREVIDEEKQKEDQEVNTQTNVNTEVQQTSSVTSRSGISVRKTIKYTNYRVTSYHPGDNCLSTNTTGSGKTTNDFTIKTICGKQVYTYKDKIVVAAATQELYNTGYNKNNAQTKQYDKHYFKYYDTFKITLDGNDYEAIVLDSCGAAMWQGEYRIDIYVPDSNNVLNRSNVTIKV